MLEKEDIEKIIPQRDPFLMIDEVEEFVPGEMAIAYKNVKKMNGILRDIFQVIQLCQGY